MIPCVTPQEMKRIDEETMRTLRCSSFGLMEKVTDEIAERFLENSSLQGRVLILCGPGNNGGDGYRLAEKLRRKKREVFVQEVLPAHSEDCKKARRLCRAKRVGEKWPKVDVVVEALFGYRGRSQLEKKVVQVLQQANHLSAKRVSLDVPTGVDSETGRVHPSTFQADLTYVIAYPKEIFVQEGVAEYLGRVEWIGNYFTKPKSSKFFVLRSEDFIFQKVKRTAHKGMFGRCGVVGGSSQTPGAAILAAEAAHRVGAGYVTLYFAETPQVTIRVKDAQFLFRLKWKSEDLLKESSLVLGCGGIFTKIPSNLSDMSSVPIVLDAEALSLWNRIKASCVLTPHPGEAARLLKCHGLKGLKCQTNPRPRCQTNSRVTDSRVTDSRPGTLETLVKMTKKAVYLKGAPGFLKFPEDNKYYVNLSANPIFAKAGSGDVLAGIMGGFLAQKPSQFRECLFSALVFQQEVGEILREKRASLVSDQLNVFSEAFRKLAT